MNYRAEIDGLRALAVIPVILFHAGFEIFGGGFVGVDVFFVISGYLITSIIINDIEKERFSIINFYERRARRILPALFFIMLITIPFAWMWMIPTQLSDYSQSLIAVSLFASNILFWRESGYFDAAAEEKPLLHTWSLAVEEQFYMFVPLLFGLFWGLGQKTLLMVLISLAFASFITALTTNSDSPMTAFYLLHTRAWELLIGVIAALKSDSIKSFKPNAALMSNIGLILIVAGLTILPSNALWPGGWTLVPVIGSLLILLFGREKSFAHAVLKLAPLRFVGLISYSAYLWHQPILSFL